MNLDTQLKEFIVVYENVLSTELCDEIIQEYSDEAEFVPAVINKEAVDTEKRKVTTIDISSQITLSKNYSIRSSLDSAIFNGVSNALHRYREGRPYVSPEIDTGYQLLRYQVGDFFAQHTDHYLDNPRTLSCSLSLNDDYQGGEFGFFDREAIIKAPKGSALLFPSSFMYPHEILPVTHGARYSIITWFV